MGDCRYGASEPLSARQIALFASEMTIAHPIRHDPLTVGAPLPAGWPWPGRSTAADAPLWNLDDFPHEKNLLADR